MWPQLTDTVGLFVLMSSKQIGQMIFDDMLINWSFICFRNARFSFLVWNRTSKRLAGHRYRTDGIVCARVYVLRVQTSRWRNQSSPFFARLKCVDSQRVTSDATTSREFDGRDRLQWRLVWFERHCLMLWLWLWHEIQMICSIFRDHLHFSIGITKLNEWDVLSLKYYHFILHKN